MRTDSPYKRRLAKGKPLWSLISNKAGELWLADDHIAILTRNIYTEKYRRIYLKDIEAVTICQTRAAVILNTILAILLIGCIGFMLFMTLYKQTLSPPEYESGIILSGIMASLIGVFLFGNLVLGPTCITTIFTAVQSERVFALSRFRKAKRVTTELKSLTEAVQGPLAPEVFTIENDRQELRLAQYRTEKQKTELVYPATAHLYFFSILLISAVADSIYFLWQYSYKSWFDILLFIPMLITGIKAFLHRYNVSASVRFWINAGLISLFLPFLGGLLASFILALYNHSLAYAFVENSLSGPPSFFFEYILLAVCIVVCTTVGILGLFNTIKYRHMITTSDIEETVS